MTIKVILLITAGVCLLLGAFGVGVSHVSLTGLGLFLWFLADHI